MVLAAELMVAFGHIAGVPFHRDCRIEIAVEMQNGHPRPGQRCQAVDRIVLGHMDREGLFRHSIGRGGLGEPRPTAEIAHRVNAHDAGHSAGISAAQL